MSENQDDSGLYEKHWQESEIPDELRQWFEACETDDYPVAPCTVLDIFAGTGTSLLAALALGRRAIGIELSPRYAELCQARLKRPLAAAQGATLPIPNGEFPLLTKEMI